MITILSLIIVGIISFPIARYIIEIDFGRQQVEPIPVSLVQLIANPAKFDGKNIITAGYLKSLSENSLENLLYIDGNSADFNIIYNSIRISLKEKNGGNIETKKVNMINLINLMEILYMQKDYF